MGHRANFVIIEDGKATAFEDEWAAIACTLQLAEGAAGARDLVCSIFEPTDELMPWELAEAGYLLDFDEKRCVAFGVPSLDPDTLSAREAAVFNELMGVLGKGWAAYVDYVGHGWQGWTMVWDERGVDAFAEHLARRKLRGVKTQRASHPASAKKGRVEVTLAAKATKAAAKPATPAKKKTAKTSAKSKAGKKSAKKTPSAARTAERTKKGAPTRKKARGASAKAKPAPKKARAGSTTPKAKKRAPAKRVKPTTKKAKSVQTKTRGSKRAK